MREKLLDGIASDGLRDESDKDGMRIVIELKRGEVTEVVLNNLYAQTPMETVFGINMVALQDGQPKLMSLKEMLEAFIRHRREVVTRRTIFDLRKARERAHVLEGLAVALANIDEIIALIKAAPAPAEARAALHGARLAAGRRSPSCSSAPARSRPARRRWRRSSACAPAATACPRCRRRPSSTCACTASPGSSRTRSSPSTRSCWTRIRDLIDILARPERLTRGGARRAASRSREAYGDARRTEINRDHLDLTTEDLIEPQDVVVTLSHAGYAKSQPLTEYQTQRRGGRGKAATAVKDEDFVEKLFVAHTHDTRAVLLQPRQGVLAARSTSCRRPDAARAASRW